MSPPAAVRLAAGPPSYAELAAILDHLPAGVLVVGSDLTVRFGNAAAGRLLHPHRLRAGHELPDLRSAPSLREEARRLIRLGALAETELSLSGNRTYLVQGAFDRRTRLAVMQLEDATARVRRTNAGEDFVVNAAHEFLSPLTAISGAAHVLGEMAVPAPEVRARFLGHIIEATDRLMAISRGLLTLARAESGVEPPRLDLVPLRPLLEEVGAASTRDITVSCPDAAAVLTDADLLRQALASLVDNARRHSTSAIEVVATEPDPRVVRIEVADDGAGILPEHLEHAGDRFFSPAGRDAGGYGIGLSIATRAVEAIGGTLTLASDRGGTRARVDVPSAYAGAE
jgi:signal transduction histidine kinase